MHPVSMSNHTCLLPASGTGAWLKRCPHGGGPVCYTLLGNETLAFFSSVFYAEHYSKREEIVFTNIFPPPQIC